jgi:hypothetical protein
MPDLIRHPIPFWIALMLHYVPRLRDCVAIAEILGMRDVEMRRMKDDTDTESDSDPEL